MNYKFSRVPKTAFNIWGMYGMEIKMIHPGKGLLFCKVTEIDFKIFCECSEMI